MLTLKRKPQQRVFIGDDIIVRVDSIVGQTVTLSFDAPRSIPISREEIYEEYKEKMRNDKSSN